MISIKVLFLQYWYDFIGGIESVNDTLATQFSSDGIKTHMLCLWKIYDLDIENHIYKKDFIGKYVKRPSYKQMVKNLFNLKFSEFNFDLKQVLKVKKQIKSDYKNYSNKIKEIAPDFIIVSSPELLHLIPKEYLNKSIIHMHSSFAFYDKNKHLIKIINKHQNKVYKIVWLTKNTMLKATNRKIYNSTYIYDPVKIKSNKLSKLNNKRIVFIGRYAPEKRLDVLINIFNIFSNKKKDWNLYLFGSGDINFNYNNNKIHICDSISDVTKELLKSDIFTLTSEYEGFSMSILEAYECGLPVITFDYDGVNEVVKNNKTGFIISNDNKEEYVKTLLKLSNNEKLMKKIGKNGKDYVKKFYPEKICLAWYDLFNRKDK